MADHIDPAMPPDPRAEWQEDLRADEPLRVARAFLNEHRERPLVYWQGTFYRWQGAWYQETSGDSLRSAVYAFLDKKQMKPNARRVSDVMDALRGQCNQSEQYSPPCILGSGEPLRDLVVFRNGALRINAGDAPPEFLQHDPGNFVVAGCDYDFVPGEAASPARWLRFLGDLWGEDRQAIEMIQEWFGLAMIAETRLQKMLLLVGPRRSGKGTIARVLRGVVGPAQIAAPTLGGLATPFGLAGLIGKGLAIIGDARLGQRTDEQVIAERLLSVTGEDAISIQRKFLPDWTGQLGVRVMMLSNELPRIGDASGALASRLLVLILKNTFEGREDPRLTDELLDERPAIAAWALQGLARLRRRGHFAQPESGRDALDAVGELGSPVAAFIADECELRPDGEVPVKGLYEAFKTWSTEQGRRHPPPANIFGRDVRAAVPGVSVTQPRSGSTRARIYLGIALKGVPREARHDLDDMDGTHGTQSTRSYISRTREDNELEERSDGVRSMSASARRAIAQACEGFALTPAQLATHLSADDLADIEAGRMSPADLQAWARTFAAEASR